MKRTLAGALALGTLLALIASACSNEPRPYGFSETAAGAQNTAGAGESSGGNQASAGKGGDVPIAGGGVGGNVGTAGAADAEGGADGDPSGCEDILGAMRVGAACGECGKYVCNPDKTTTSCSDPKLNACGGCAKLAAAPETACGECGMYECAADKEAVACKDPGKNACGGCGALANAPSSTCGSCGNWECTADKTDVKCSGVNANVCGGCGTLANAPGVACGQCGKYECSSDKASTACNDPGKNACGGCTALTGTVGGACGNGSCGKLACAADKNSLACTGDSPNACGGCSALTPAGATKDGSCGSCGRTWACNGDMNSLSCAGTMPNACGGCTPITGTVGASCGACSVTACAADKNSLDCKSQCTGPQVCVSGLNQCKAPDCSAANSCGKSDGAGSTCTNAKGNCPAKPNSAGSCSGSSCAYVCNGSYFAATLSCSTTGEPACGSWNFESNTFEGWRIDGASTAATSALSLPAPPGGTGYGSHSLAVNVDGAQGDLLKLSLDFCPGGVLATGIAGAFNAKVWFKPSDANGGLSGPGYCYLNDGNSGTVGSSDFNCPAGQWFDVASSYVMGVSVKTVELSIGGITGHKGTLFFDNLHFD